MKKITVRQTKLLSKKMMGAFLIQLLTCPVLLAYTGSAKGSSLAEAHVTLIPESNTNPLSTLTPFNGMTAGVKGNLVPNYGVNGVNGMVADVTVSGTVVDGNGEPIPGATVSVQGTTTGTATDIDGRYSLVVPEGSILVFSFIGYVTQPVALEGRTVIDVVL